MEARKSASLGAMGSLLSKLDELLLRTKDRVLNIIRQLREDVSSISTKLVELSEVDDPPLTVKYWVKEARELSYDMEDCVDQFVHADSDAKMAWTEEISGFSTRVEEVMERYHRFMLGSVHSRTTSTNTAASHHLRMVYEDANHAAPVGMEGPKNEMLGWLKPNGDDENDRHLKVTTIFGVDGIGKSTLAQELWCVLVEEFECKAFVKASKKPDVRTILRSILSQVRPQHRHEACQVPDLIHSISKHLQDKRYFIVIDDLWTASVWDTLSRAFPEGNCCSRIVTTTTIENVALACCSYDPEHIFKMKSLSCDGSKVLFDRRVFGSGKECPLRFHDVSDEITGKCGGLPLAITCIASLVAKQPEIANQWEYVRNFLHDNLRINSTSVEILKQVLNLCYNSLPDCLKTCLLYLSMYPENYIILKEDLVKQWIAEDFIYATEEKDMIDVASSYFDEMVSLDLIQRMGISDNKKGVAYVVHPLVFEFIKCQSIEDNFTTVIDYSQSIVALTEKIRRLSLQFGSATYATTPASIGLFQVRSLSFMGLLNCVPALTDFKLVRVIILHVLVDSGETSFSITGIRELLLLRYLQVRCNATVELPDQIGCLKYLETLEIHARVAAVPSDVLHLPRLQNLRLGRKRYLYRKYYPSEKQKWVQKIELSNQDKLIKKQHEMHKEDLSNDQPGVLREMAREDMKKPADTGFNINLDVHVKDDAQVPLSLPVQTLKPQSAQHASEGIGEKQRTRLYGGSLDWPEGCLPDGTVLPSLEKMYGYRAFQSIPRFQYERSVADPILWGVKVSDDDTESSDDDDVGAWESTLEVDDSVVDEKEVDKKAEEFIASFREKIRRQRIESIKRSSGQAASTSTACSSSACNRV